MHPFAHTVTNRRMARGEWDQGPWLLRSHFYLLIFFNNIQVKILSLLLDNMLGEYYLLLSLVPASLEYSDSELLAIESNNHC